MIQAGLHGGQRAQVELKSERWALHSGGPGRGEADEGRHDEHADRHATLHAAGGRRLLHSFTLELNFSNSRTHS